MAYAAALNANFAGQVVGFDTFEGHTVRPLENELDLHGRQQSKVFDEIIGSGQRWAACTLEQVQSNFLKAEGMLGTKLSRELVKGDACETAVSISNFGEEVSLLRLDMDWYLPTVAALEAVSPRLSKDAIIIVDDYGHHSGVKKAIDEFLSKTKRGYDYTMTDYSCLRICFLG